MLQTPIVQPRVLVCWDFDGTLVKGHFHNTLDEMQVRYGRATLEHVEMLIARFGLKNPEEVCDSIRQTIVKGGYVSIVSFTKYPEMIKPTLQNMGLEEELLEKVYIRGDFPADGPQSPTCKEEHIQDAMRHFGMDVINDADKVILADDNLANVFKAKNDKHYGVHVSTRHDHLNIKDVSYVKEVNGYVDEIINLQRLGAVIESNQILNLRRENIEHSSCYSPSPIVRAYQIKQQQEQQHALSEKIEVVVESPNADKPRKTILLD